MLSIEEKLLDYEERCSQVLNQNFKSFGELEIKYCQLINEGNSYRTEILKNKGLCDPSSIKVLTNESNDISLLDKKYKAILNITYLIKSLLHHYEIYLSELLKNENYEEAIQIYNQMFLFTKNYLYKQKIANIYYKIFRDVQTAYNIYMEIQPYMENNKDYWWQLSDIYRPLNDTFNCVMCIKKACELEQQEYGES